MGIPKTIQQELGELEDHLYLLVGALNGLGAGERAHLRHLAAELRVLICLSSGTEGLLWRLVDELGVPDDVQLHQVGNIDTTSPLASGLSHAFAPLCTPGRGDARLPVTTYSLRELIKSHEAVFVAAHGVTHEQLIKWIAQQMGSSHEGHEISPTLAELNAILIADVQSFFQILHSDAVLTVEIGERVLSQAVARGAYQRRCGSFSYAGDVSLPGEIAVTASLPAPTLDPINEEEGTVFFLLRPNEEDWREPGVVFRFPPYQVGRARFETTTTSEGFLELRCSGLFSPEFIYRTPRPTLDERGLTIAVTWNRLEISVYVNSSLPETFVRSAGA